MGITIAKWTIDQYHELIATGILDDRSNNGYETETRLSSGTFVPLSFPDIEVDVKRLFSV